MSDTVRRILDSNSLRENYFLQSDNPAFRTMLERCRQVASSMAGILLIGESGVGKEIIAQYIHALSPRADKPFVAVNCGSFSMSLLDSELFGHEQGAFTGAVKPRAGKFEIAAGGTFFLDEIGEIEPSIQIKLLRTLESKTIERLGGNNLRKIDFRLISATNRPLDQAVISGQFREDFFYRVSPIVIEIPPLRQRREDIPPLLDFFIAQLSRENGKPISRIEPEVWEFLVNYDYPGNIREMKNIIERMVVLSEQGVITAAGLPVKYNLFRRQHPLPAAGGDILPWKAFKEQSERAYLEYALSTHDYRIGEAARTLGISPRQIYNKINEYGIELPGHPRKKSPSAAD